ncbi:hypothetical protein [Rhizobium tumorigenes]|uniref:hypothetical protein n=1 Tax=Rhizobium tumorigenes TaxID=2041385 RepID=UPI00241EC7A0|nr:hypothetical protein [Rhizobium tumorigenes]WFR99956.1 hypothetical protein PR016_12435 [Rhizobium tumorigenes]
MKASIVTSAVVHGLVLVWALVTIGAPKSFEVQPDESTPVEIVTDVSMTQTGDKKAPQKDKAAPKPTTKQTEIANAQNAGENDVDLKSAPKPVPKPTENQSTGAPKKVEAPTPKVDPTPNDVKSVEKEETDVAPPPPTPTPTAAPKPPTPTPVPTPTPPPPTPTPTPTPTPPPPAPAPTQDKAELAPSDQATPDNVPVPQLKPQPPAPPKVAEKPVEKPPEKKPDTKPVEKPADKSSDTDKKKDDKKREVAKTASSKDSDLDMDEISALLNQEKATGGGAKRQQHQAALGTDKPANGAKLSQSEVDAMKSQIQNNWNVPAGMSGVEGMVIRVHFKLDESGQIVGEPEVTATGGSSSSQDALAGSAKRAVMMSSPFKNLPRDKYDAWSEVVINFDPSQLGL